MAKPAAYRSGTAVTGPSLRRDAVRLLLVAVLIGGVTATIRPATARQPEVVTARLGISAGADIEEAPLGLAGPDLRALLPLLFETADRLDVVIETVSVGQGFYTDGDGILLSERDLDLLVSGRRDAIHALAAILGRAWDQSLVFVWHADPAGATATATIPLPGGVEALTPDVYTALVAELTGGGHVRYAGAESLIFVANTGDEADIDFMARMERVRQVLAGAGIFTGPIRHERTTMLALDRDSYDDYIGLLWPATVRERLPWP